MKALNRTGAALAGGARAESRAACSPPWAGVHPPSPKQPLAFQHRVVPYQREARAEEVCGEGCGGVGGGGRGAGR